MNIKQIEYELKRKKADLAWWTEHKNDIASRNDEGGMVGVCDLQIDLARERLQSLQGQLAQRVELEDFARQYCRCGDDDLSEFTSDELEEVISDRTADLRDYS